MSMDICLDVYYTTNANFSSLLSILTQSITVCSLFDLNFYYLFPIRHKVLLFVIRSTQSFTIYVTTKLQCE